MSTIAAGTRVGPFVVESVLGAGGMGIVYKAHDASGGGEVALKVMAAHAAESHEARRRFAREARATMALDHPNIIRILGSLEHEGMPVIAMEVLRGTSLKQRIEQHGRLGYEEAADVFARVASAVGTAHALGLVHRDLKPDNVFLLDDAPHVKVLDFGIAKIRSGAALDASGALTRTGMMVGTPYYMSPEQAFGDKSIDHRSDIWSLGLMLYEALTGTLPTRATSLETVFTRLMTMRFVPVDEVDPTIPAAIARMLDRMLQRNRDHRPTDLREVYQVLAPYAAGAPSQPDFASARTPLSFSEAMPGSLPPQELAGAGVGPASRAPELSPTRGDWTLASGGLYRPTADDDPPALPRSRADLLLWIVAVVLASASIVALVARFG